MSQTVLAPFNSIVSGTCLRHLRHIWKPDIDQEFAGTLFFFFLLFFNIFGIKQILDCAIVCKIAFEGTLLCFTSSSVSASTYIIGIYVQYYELTKLSPPGH